jgi:hypothetical protein
MTDKLHNKKCYKYKTKIKNLIIQSGGTVYDCFICSFSNDISKGNQCINCGYFLKKRQYKPINECITCGYENNKLVKDPSGNLSLSTKFNCFICGTNLSGVVVKKSKKLYFEDLKPSEISLYENTLGITKDPSIKLPSDTSIDDSVGVYDFIIPDKLNTINRSIIEIYKEKIVYINDLRHNMNKIRENNTKIGSGYVDFFMDEKISDKSYFDMIENIKLPNSIDNPIIFIKEFTRQIFDNISINPYPFENDIYKGVNRWEHGTLNHLRSLLFAIEMTIIMKKNTPKLFSKLFDITDVKKKNFLVVSILSALFKSLLRIDETGTGDSGSYYITPDILYKTFDEKNVLQHFNNYSQVNEISNLQPDTLLKLNLEETKKKPDVNKYVFYNDIIPNRYSYGGVDLSKYYHFKNNNYKKPTDGKKRAIILFGNPGAGKSIAKNKVYSKLNLTKENFIEIDPDEVRHYHPLYLDDITGKTFYEKLKTDPTLFSNTILDSDGIKSISSKMVLKGKDWKSPNGDESLNRIGYTLGDPGNETFVSLKDSVIRSRVDVQDSIQNHGNILDTYIVKGYNIVYDTSCTDNNYCINTIYYKFLINNYEVTWLGVNTVKAKSMERANKRQFIDGRYMNHLNYLESTSKEFSYYENLYEPIKILDKLAKVKPSGSSGKTDYIIFYNNDESPILQSNSLVDYTQPVGNEILNIFDIKNSTAFPPMVFASSILLFSILKSKQKMFKLTDEDISRISYSSSYYISAPGQKIKNRNMINIIDEWNKGTNQNLLDDDIITSNDFRMILADLYSNIGHYFDHCRAAHNNRSRSVYNYRSNLFRKLVKVTVDDDVNLVYGIMEALRKTNFTDKNGPNLFKSRPEIRDKCISQPNQFPEEETPAEKMVKNCCSPRTPDHMDFNKYSKNFEEAWNVYEFDVKLQQIFLGI